MAPKADEGRTGGRRPLPAVLPPGLTSTVEVLRRRAAKGQTLHDPADVQEHDSAGIRAVQLKNNTQARAGVVIERDGARLVAGFGARLREIRRGRKMSQRQLAARAYLSQSLLSRLESGERIDVQLASVVALANALRLPLDTLLGRTIPAAS